MYVALNSRSSSLNLLSQGHTTTPSFFLANSWHEDLRKLFPCPTLQKNRLPRKETCLCGCKDSDSCCIMKQNWDFPTKHTSELFGHGLQHLGTNDCTCVHCLGLPLWSRIFFGASNHNARCKVHCPTHNTATESWVSRACQSVVKCWAWWLVIHHQGNNLLFTFEVNTTKRKLRGQGLTCCAGDFQTQNISQQAICLYNTLPWKELRVLKDVELSTQDSKDQFSWRKLHSTLWKG